MNNHNPHLNNTQPWMMSAEHGPEQQYNYMISRPPGSVLPMPPPPQQQQQHQQHSRQLSREEELSISPQAQALDYDPTKYKGPNRPVIPSKRAAQNRAAQKAFRQRREQYIKDLEIKAKEMEDWQNELDRLRKENGELRDRVSVLENQVSILTGGDPTKIPVIQQPPSTNTTTTTTTTATRKYYFSSNLPRSTTTTTIVYNSPQGGEYWNNSHMQVPEFDLDFDFDPFFEEEFGPTLTHHNDFLPSANSGQVLDDLFAMLQTRQRPQIPIAPTNEENVDTT
ncbi:hypothetical protein BD770DRAFT_342314 [Pilaira anomala]|nr:hypothetical protein BD770DRAFT_342314 [Pilaira anomala]